MESSLNLTEGRPLAAPSNLELTPTVASIDTTDLGITTEDIFPSSEELSVTTRTDDNDREEQLINSYVRNAKYRHLPDWPGRSLANRVLTQSTHLVDAPKLYSQHVLETWPDDSAYTAKHREELIELLNPKRITSRRQIREQERLVEMERKRRNRSVRHLSSLCISWVVQKHKK